MTITDRNGRNLGADAGIGNNMLIQEVYGRGQTWHMTQFWLNQSFLDNRVQWKFGRMTVGEDFASFSCDFQNLTFCGSQPGNLVGSYWVNWPTSQWATRLKVNTSEQTYRRPASIRSTRSTWTTATPAATGCRWTIPAAPPAR